MEKRDPKFVGKPIKDSTYQINSNNYISDLSFKISTRFRSKPFSMSKFFPSLLLKLMPFLGRTQIVKVYNYIHLACLTVGFEFTKNNRIFHALD